MSLVLAFALTLMLAVLLSEYTQRSVLSTSVIFLLAGGAVGVSGLQLVGLEANNATMQFFAELALFGILFVEGTELPLRRLSRAWRLPGRAILLGMPLTAGCIAVGGHFAVGMTWLEAFLVGAILSPTDPTLVGELLRREAVPRRLRRLLAVESGLNDGLALPVVMTLLDLLRHQEPRVWSTLGEGGLGIALGVVVPAVFTWLEKRSFFGASERYRALGGIALGCGVYALSALLHANEFLAAFASGATLATTSPALAAALKKIGDPATEALKLAALLILGAMLSVRQLLATGIAGFGFALIALLAARPLALGLALVNGGLSRGEWFAAAWFGPKGFSSLFYALLLLQSGVPRGHYLFQLVALVIVLSILAHSSTDVLVGRRFKVPHGLS
jgi:NhaP-type Na+/H+ or K+/H+ antiporter